MGLSHDGECEGHISRHGATILGGGVTYHPFMLHAAHVGAPGTRGQPLGFLPGLRRPVWFMSWAMQLVMQAQ